MDCRSADVVPCRLSGLCPNFGQPVHHQRGDLGTASIQAQDSQYADRGPSEAFLSGPRRNHDHSADPILGNIDVTFKLGFQWTVTLPVSEYTCDGCNVNMPSRGRSPTRTGRLHLSGSDANLRRPGRLCLRKMAIMAMFPPAVSRPSSEPLYAGRMLGLWGQQGPRDSPCILAPEHCVS